ncbi:MAG TPA: phage portal protein [Gemmatales bacterium]|nr:phage portal protein [Gemmatales bacterium]
MHWFWEPLARWYARCRLERLQCEAAARWLEAGTVASPVAEPDAAAWQLIAAPGAEADAVDRQPLRDRARRLAETNPYAHNALGLYRHYVVGPGMRFEIQPRQPDLTPASSLLRHVQQLWDDFRAANAWDSGARKDWEFCHRTWRDGECFLRLFPQADWPPRIHFIDPELVAGDPAPAQPRADTAPAPDTVEVPTDSPLLRPDGRREVVPASLVLHAKIGVDGNVKRGLPILTPVLDALKRYQGWLDVELLQRKVAASVVLVRKHQQQTPAGLKSFTDAVAALGATAAKGPAGTDRPLTLRPGSIIDAQGVDLELLAPNTHFTDASLLGRSLLLAIAAGLGLPDYMLTSDASNGNYASTLVAEGPAVRLFAAWQAYFVGQWQRLFAFVLEEAVRLGLITPFERDQVSLRITPPSLAVRQRWEEARADALYFDRGALSARELARRDQADPDLMQRERQQERAPQARTWPDGICFNSDESKGDDHAPRPPSQAAHPSHDPQYPERPTRRHRHQAHRRPGCPPLHRTPTGRRRLPHPAAPPPKRRRLNPASHPIPLVLSRIPQLWQKGVIDP